MKKWLPTAVVLATLACLGAWVLLFESKPKTGEEGRDTLWKLKQEKIVKFELRQLDRGTAVVCEKDKAGTWWITAPGKYEADLEAVTPLLQQLGAPLVERRLGPQAEAGSFGLNKPSFRATVTLKGGKSKSLETGSKNPAETAWFAREEGGKEIVTIASWSLEAFRKTFSELRSRTPVPFEPTRVSRLEIERQTGGTLEFRRAGPEAWKMLRPAEGEADHYALDGLLNSLKTLRGTEIIDETGATARYRLEDPLVRIKIWTGKGDAKDKPLIVSLSQPNPKRDDAYAVSTRLPFVVRIPSAAPVKDASKPVDDYRERVLLSANRDELREAIITYGGKEIACRKGFGERWSIVSPKGAKADEPMNDMLFELVYVRAEKFLSEKPKSYSIYGLEPAVALVSVKGVKDGKKFANKYSLGAIRNGVACLRWEDKPAVYGVRPELLSKVVLFADMVLNPRPEAKPAAPAKPSPKRAAKTALAPSAPAGSTSSAGSSTGKPAPALLEKPAAKAAPEKK